ncbi:hypothetical protein OOK31_14850 [Streptomyces sp. NBC_00249]|uniref:hypothetical protein n=1 Tax=Streptomyces sp. NBC_00249 TaxID=2975690 RepID=UPI00225B24F0|nr:hypothetical protein [Streptomyces sp. NBC_00249]MCX5195163.1 hypothetical protein [Streptomyces sp. NBC_00249]
MGRREHQTTRPPAATPAPAAVAPAGQPAAPSGAPAGNRPATPAVAPTGTPAVAARAVARPVVPAQTQADGPTPRTVRRPAPTAPAPVPGTEPDRWRYAQYLDRLAAVAGTAGEAVAVAEVLCDPDPVMAESAVVTHLDRRALRLLPDAGFPGWARALRPVLDGRAFAARRLREWTLLQSIASGAAWSPAELTAASDWCQRTAAQTLASPDPRALALLAAAARTHRVRNAAAQRLRRRAIA